MTKETTRGKFDFVELPAGSVDELEKARSFYSSVFGWDFKPWGDDYVDTKDGGLGCGINADAGHRPKSPLVVIFVRDLEVMLERVTQAGGTITKDIFAFPGGRRFHFRDPGGNELAVWSDA